MKIIWLLPIMLSLGGCVTTGTGSIFSGQCNLPGVHTPEYAVKGRTKYDQNWADDTTEGLVRGCGQPRPKARPASFDKPRPKKKAAAPLPAAPKKHWWQRKKKPPSA